MKNKKMFLLAWVLFLLSAPLVGIKASGEELTVEAVIREIMADQSVSAASQIECDQVSDERFEELGEAVMSVMHPEERQHELMDEMMGGEGSSSLKAMHIAMGQNYLSCGGSMGINGMGMMGGGMMGGGMMGGGMMGSYWPKVGNFSNPLASGAGGREGYTMMGLSNMGFGWGVFGWIFMILFWLVIILGIIWLIKNLVGKSSKYENEKQSRALEILKERYAKGEINKTEFNEKRKDLV